MQQEHRGHLAAIGTVSVWGATFISTKVLLRHFTPTEILVLRFVLGLVALWVISPKRMPLKSRRHTLYFAGAGLSGLVLYYLCENIALNYGDASIVGVVVSSAPLFSGICAAIFLGERIRAGFALGFVIAISGICLISFGSGSAHIQPKGLALSLLAAVAWGVYSTLTRKIAEYGYPTVGTTKLIFMYGVLMMIPIAAVSGFRLSALRTAGAIEIGNLLFLGLGASAICFVTWNFAVKVLGSVKTCAYIYASPVVTVILAAVILHEQLTLRAAAGMVLVLAGLVLSEHKTLRKEGQNGEV